MSPEIYWLTLVVVYTALLWMPYAGVRIAKIGLVRLLVNPLPGDDPFDKPWAHRAYRAHMNAIEALTTFAPLALAVVVTGSGNEVTALACKYYAYARLLHAPIYILKIPVLRLLTFMVGLGATLVLAGALIM